MKFSKNSRWLIPLNFISNKGIMETHLSSFVVWLHSQLNLWVAIGLFGQSLFMMRFLVQWIYSERVKQSVIPEAFWYLSLGGGLIVLAYAIHKQDLVFILSQGLGSFIYIRNIQLIWQQKLKQRVGTRIDTIV